MSSNRIVSVFLFPNGNVAVFDQFGKQMPDYQGSIDLDRKRLSTIAVHAPEGVEWYGCSRETFARLGGGR